MPADIYCTIVHVIKRRRFQFCNLFFVVVSFHNTGSIFIIDNEWNNCWRLIFGDYYNNGSESMIRELWFETL